MYFFLKYLVTLFYKKPKVKIVVSFLCESGPLSMESVSPELLAGYLAAPLGSELYTCLSG